MVEPPKPVRWLGDSRDRLRRFSEEARRETGYQLSLVQFGLQTADWRPMPDIGSGVIEIRIHAKGEYRVFYVAKFEEAIFVLHVFAKKSRKTAPLDIHLGQKRYKELLESRKK